ncbi:MAG: hypothetical protein FGM36_14195 [Burkholderiaceae bacterium]|nr:hypothetical protein [Burkholderiaceae bacterium]
MVETEDLVNLPSKLVEKSNSFRAFKDLPLPRLNISSNSEYPLLWNDQMKREFEKSYSGDLALYQGFKANSSKSVNSINQFITQALKELNIYKHALIAARKTLKKYAIKQ